jgi:hypothetical protein
MARLAGVDDSGLVRSFQAAEQNPSKLVEMLINTGLEGADILRFPKTGIPDEAVAVILEYYAMHAGKRCTQHPASQGLTAF